MTKKEYQRQYREKNREKLRKKDRERYRKNKAKKLEKQKLRYKIDPSFREYMKNYSRKYREQNKTKLRRYYENHKQEILEKARKYRQTPEYKRKRREYEKRRRQRPEFKEKERIRNRKRWKTQPTRRAKTYVKKKGQKIPIHKQCEFCPSTGHLERHHPDYNYPDIFVTVCSECHWYVHQSQEPKPSITAKMGYGTDVVLKGKQEEL